MKIGNRRLGQICVWVSAGFLVLISGVARGAAPETQPVADGPPIEFLSERLQEAMGIPFGPADAQSALTKLSAAGVTGEGAWGGPNAEAAWPIEVLRNVNGLVGAVNQGAPRGWLEWNLLNHAHVQGVPDDYGSWPREDAADWLPGYKQAQTDLAQLVGTLWKEAKTHHHIPASLAPQYGRAFLLLGAATATQGSTLAWHFQNADEVKKVTGMPADRCQRVARVFSEYRQRYEPLKAEVDELAVQGGKLCVWQAVCQVTNSPGPVADADLQLAVKTLDGVWSKIGTDMPYLKWREVNLAWQVLNWAYEHKDDRAKNAVTDLLQHWQSGSREKYVIGWIEEALATRAPAPEYQDIFPADEPKLPAEVAGAKNLVTFSLMYALNKNKGYFPDRDQSGKLVYTQEEAFDRMIQEGYMLLSYIVPPGNDLPVPPEFAKWDQPRRVKFLHEHGAYIMITGLADTVDPADKTIYFFEKPNFGNGKRIAVAYRNGEAEFLAIEDVSDLLKRQTGRTLEQWVDQNQPADRGAHP